MMNSFAESEHARVSREIEVRFYAELNDFLRPEKRVDFGHLLKGGERLAVYPMFERYDVSLMTRLRPAHATFAGKPAEEPCERLRR